MKNKIKNFLKFFDNFWENTENKMFDNKDEIVEFDADAFKEYRQYDKAYPDRFRVKYDEDHNRIW